MRYSSGEALGLRRGRNALTALTPPSVRLAKRALMSWFDGEPELHLLSRLCSREKWAIDVGANNGVYTWHLARRSAGVVAFEPQPSHAHFLERALGTRVQVEQVALSDSSGEALLRVPEREGQDGCATIEAENRLADLKCETYKVPVRRLDDYSFAPVGLIKIDVEGHELSVLKGATRLLERDRPNLIIEAEERHRAGAVDSVCRFLEPFGYRSLYLRDGALHELISKDGDGKHAGGDRASDMKLFNFIFMV